MRLSTKGRYAVMAMADLAARAAEAKPVALADIAERQDISLSYLEQLFAKLRRGGLVTSVRGPGGGYRLARPSGELRIADIIVAVDEPIAATRCQTGSATGCTKTGARCVTHDLWEELGQQIHIFLSSVSLADVVEKRVLGRSRPCNDTGALADGMAMARNTPRNSKRPEFMFYCDHNATAPLRPVCREAVMRALAIGGNPASVHGAGRAARALVEEARASVAELAAAKADQVIFTSGATEANALALWGAVEGARPGGAPITRLLVSATAHSSILAPSREIAAQTPTAQMPAVRLEILPVTPDGVLDIAALRALLGKDDGRALLAVMAANNETGVMQPIAEISRLAKDAGALLLVDAVAAAGKCALDAALCDYLTLSAHKLGGPQGAGALIVAENAPLAPQLTGGGQQKGLRAGTENLSGIAGFGAAAQAVLHDRAEPDRVKILRDRFESALRAALPGAVIFGGNVTRLCGTSNVALPGLSGENVVIALDLDGIAVSSGSACSSGKVAPSHVLSAMGVNDALAGAALRVSFGWNSTEADGDAVVAALLRLSARVRSCSSERAA